MNKKTLFNYFYHSSYKLLTMLLPIITIPIVSRAIGPEGIGLWNYVNSIVNYFYLIASLGLAAYGVREVAKVRDDKEKLSDIFWELQTFNMMFSSLTLLIFLVFTFFTDYSIFFLIQSVFLLGAFLDISWFFIGIEEFKNVTIIKFVIKVLAFVAIVLFVKDANDLLFYFIIQSSTHVIPELLYWGMIRNRVSRFKFTRKVFRHIKPALAFVIPRVSTILNVTMSKTILGIFATIEMVGYYSTSLSLVILSGGLIMALNDVMLPRLSHMTNDKNDTRFIDVFSKSVHIQLFLSIPITFGIILVSSTMIGWFYGDQFTFLHRIIPLLAPILIIQSLQASLGIQYFIPQRLMKEYNTATLTGSLLSLTFNLIFTRFFGIYAVIVGVSLGYLTMCTLMSRHLYKRTTFRYNYGQIMKTVIASAVMYVLTSLISLNFTATAVSTFLQVFIGGGIYLIVVTLLGGNPLFKGGQVVSIVKIQFSKLNATD